MATIKAMILEKIREQSHGTLRQEDLNDENVRKELEKYLHVVCLALPGENNPDENPEGADLPNDVVREQHPAYDYQAPTPTPTPTPGNGE